MTEIEKGWRAETRGARPQRLSPSPKCTMRVAADAVTLHASALPKKAAQWNSTRSSDDPRGTAATLGLWKKGMLVLRGVEGNAETHNSLTPLLLVQTAPRETETTPAACSDRGPLRSLAHLSDHSPTWRTSIGSRCAPPSPRYATWYRSHDADPTAASPKAQAWSELWRIPSDVRVELRPLWT